MRRQPLSVALLLLLCLSLAACGQAAIATPMTVPPTATRPPRAAAVQPTSPATRPQPAATLVRPNVASPGAGTPVAPLPAGVVAVPSLGAQHVSEGQPLVIPHSPPSSGQHYPSALPAGIYRQGAQPGNWIHSLEHGYVVALVRCSADCNAIFDQLQTISTTRLSVSRFGNVKFIATTYNEPFTNGEAQIALVAWGYELLLPTLDASRIVGFYARFVDQGPELVP